MLSKLNNMEGVLKNQLGYIKTKKEAFSNKMMVSTWAQKLSKADLDHVLEVFCFNYRAAAQLVNNNINGIICLNISKRDIYDAITNAQRNFFTTTGHRYGST